MYYALPYVFCTHTHTHTRICSETRARSLLTLAALSYINVAAVHKRSLCVAAAAAASAIVVVVASAFVTRDTKEISSTARCIFRLQFILFY